MPPDRIFIIPFKNRQQHLYPFLNHMYNYLINLDNKINKFFFINQCQNIPFNRGAMKNIGFLYVKKKWPNDYKHITLIFHDIDSLPRYNNIIPYDTQKGTVCHYYGRDFALGGLFAIKGEDFEKTKGFPNFWGWGLEDNLMQERALKYNLKIDRSIFFHIIDTKNIIRLFDGYKRILGKRDINIYKFENPDCLLDIQNLHYTVDSLFIHPNKINSQNQPKTSPSPPLIFYEMINVNNFITAYSWNDQDYQSHDIRNGPTIRIPSNNCRRNWKMY